KKRKFIFENLGTKNDSIRRIMQKDLTIIETTIKNDYYKRGLEKELESEWKVENLSGPMNKKVEDFFASYKKFYQDAYNKAVASREAVIFKMENEKGTNYNINAYKNRYYNESLADLVKNVSEKERIIEHDGQLFQQINPIFLDPKPNGLLDYRAHFFAPQKNLFGAPVSTFLFNNIIIWIMTVMLYITLYFELLRKLINSFDGLPPKINLSKPDQLKKK
ncbi:MAG: ABC transporter, partial [Marivirga sp.]|nr:ABC transporter [Marivirga sp.]